MPILSHPLHAVPAPMPIRTAGRWFIRRTGNLTSRHPALVQFEVSSIPALRIKPSIELLLQSAKKPPLVLAGWVGTVQQRLPRVVREDLRFAFRGLNLKVQDQTRLAAGPGSVTVPVEEDFHADDVLPRLKKWFQIDGICIQMAGIAGGGPH